MTEQQPDTGFFQRLKNSLKKTHENIVRRIEELTLGKREISPEMIEHLEETLITADLGAATVQELIDTIKWKVARKELENPESIQCLIKQELFSILHQQERPLQIDPSCQPFVILTVGVNGTGKTTTIAKLGALLQSQGLSVMLAAADTFRAAAIEQLEIWAQRIGCAFVKHRQGADPSAVAFDALKSARARHIDVLIIDTAGRLHTKMPLMEEIKKVYRILSREHTGAPHETLLVLDATTGQNAISQASLFKDAINITGIALTKLDGTAKGGVIVGISRSLNIPIRFIGVGEKLDDLREFHAKDFIDALFEA
ncbi:MAG: signal recognition particle-docking protein FtsY [Desulfobacterota bacterium]|nr:signal recognition particle-docking protein FtsY [Thermodesulfobacteriota bacterium]